MENDFVAKSGMFDRAQIAANGSLRYNNSAVIPTADSAATTQKT
jgi:hypothetical protein